MSDESSGTVNVSPFGLLFTVVSVWSALHMDKAFTVTDHVPSVVSGAVEWMVWVIIAWGSILLVILAIVAVCLVAAVAMKVEQYLNGGRYV